MRYVLTDYQEIAAIETTRRLRQATREFNEERDYSSVSLTAPTGAGKTVIAASVIERIFFGDDAVEPDPLATVLWLTDNPSLNEQTKRKMVMASTELKPRNLISIDSGYDAETFDANYVYFLNIQKLARTSTMVQSGTDLRRWSLWETINKSIKKFGGHFYLVIDEAHRGTGSPDRTRPTIVARIIGGLEGQTQASPIVWGISATPERFQQAMAVAAEPSRTQREIKVPIEDVRASGLLKDTLEIIYPQDSQPSVATLTRLAADNLRSMSERWDSYSIAQDEPPVKPVLVVQVQSQETDANIETILSTLKDSWGVLEGRAVGHSFDSHVARNIGTRSIRYISPEDIQDDSDLRVVLFKQALTTGWDCPRAETMLSFYRAEDFTYIAQLMGRMVRTPLARRITSDEVLNSVSLFLPNYDRESVRAVIANLQADSSTPPIEILQNAVHCPRNPQVPAEIFEILESLPTYVVPGHAHKSQVTRLHTLATRLTGDAIVEDAITKANLHLIATVNRERERLTSEGSLSTRLIGLGRVNIGRISMSYFNEGQTFQAEEATPDSRDINELFKSARRSLRDGLAIQYWSWLLDQSEDSIVPGMLLPDEAKLIVSALAGDPLVIEAVELSASELIRTWLREYSRAISNLPAAAKSAYQAVRAQATESEETTLTLPSEIIVSAPDGVVSWPRHVYAPVGADFPSNLNGWEADVLNIEIRNGAIAWYRNPTGGERALRIPYRENEGDHDIPFYPDFLIFHETSEGIRPSIIDPHDFSYSDTGPKWRGLAKFAQNHGQLFNRIDAVIKDENGDLLRLDLQDSTIRMSLTNLDGRESALAIFRQFGGRY